MNLIRGLITAPIILHLKVWRRAENSNLTQFPVPSGFEAVPARLSG